MSLPESWVETKVGKVVIDLQPGFAQKPGEKDEGSTPQIRTHNISPEGKIVLDGIKHVSASSNEMKRCQLAIDDVVFNNTNSEEWVGKTAIFDQEGEYVFSNHMTRLRADTSLINPNFLASYLHLLWSMGYSKTRAKRWVSQAGIEGAALASFKLPLPTLPEQQRIVEVLQQAEAITKLRKQFDELLGRVKQQLFVEMFGDPNPKGSEWTAVKLGSVVTVATGGTPSREQSDNFGGAVAWVKSTDLTDEPILRTDERLTDTGIQRSNAKVYPKNTVLLAMYGQGQTRGRTGKLMIDAACNQACAALLPSEELLPDYLWAWFQMSYGAVRSLGRGGQQENLNLDIVRNIRLPKPPIPLQQEFSRRLGQLLGVVKTTRGAKKQTELLLDALRIEALSGGATSAWREQHREEILNAAQARDVALRERGTRVSVRITESAPPERPTSYTRPARRWLTDELSEFQFEVWSMLRHEWRGSVIVDDPEVFGDFCASPQTAWRIEHFNASPSRVRRTLEQLAALGLIAKVSVPKINALTGQTEYMTAFRPLREEENTRLSDADALRRELRPDKPEEVS